MMFKAIFNISIRMNYECQPFGINYSLYSVYNNNSKIKTEQFEKKLYS